MTQLSMLFHNFLFLPFHLLQLYCQIQNFNEGWHSHMDDMAHAENVKLNSSPSIVNSWQAAFPSAVLMELWHGLTLGLF